MNGIELIMRQFIGDCEPNEITELVKAAIIDKKYVLKEIGKDKNIKIICDIIEKLYMEGVPVPRLLHTIRGEKYYKSGYDQYMVTAYVEGVIVYPFILMNNLILTRDLGSKLARLHCSMSRLVYKKNSVKNGDLYDEYRHSIQNLSMQDIIIGERILDICDLGYKNLELPKQLIHRDVRCANFLVENSRIQCFLDFDSMECNIRIYDIVYLAITTLNMCEINVEIMFEKWLIFLKMLVWSYHKESNLAEVEVNSLYTCLLMMQICFIDYYRESGYKDLNHQLLLLECIYNAESRIKEI